MNYEHKFQLQPLFATLPVCACISLNTSVNIFYTLDIPFHSPSPMLIPESCVESEDGCVMRGGAVCVVEIFVFNTLKLEAPKTHCCCVKYSIHVLGTRRRSSL